MVGNWPFKYFCDFCEIYTYIKYLLTSMFIFRIVSGFTKSQSVVLGFHINEIFKSLEIFLGIQKCGNIFISHCTSLLLSSFLLLHSKQSYKAVFLRVFVTRLHANFSLDTIFIYVFTAIRLSICAKVYQKAYNPT